MNESAERLRGVMDVYGMTEDDEAEALLDAALAAAYQRGRDEERERIRAAWNDAHGGNANCVEGARDHLYAILDAEAFDALPAASGIDPERLGRALSVFMRGRPIGWASQPNNPDTTTRAWAAFRTAGYAIAAAYDKEKP